jgi:heterodisulfide reductase subunit A
MNRKIGTALVVGAGIGGMRAAMDLAEFGYGVTLIDRAPHLGGLLSQLDYQFPTDRCGMCKMLPLIDRDISSQYCLRKGFSHENIQVLLSTELSAVKGEAGHFDVTLKQKQNWVDPFLCVGCGLCTEICPVEVPDEFNAGLSRRKAIYLPVPHATPNPFIIDIAACTRCGECEKICPTHAIRLSQQDRKKFGILVVDDELIVRDSLKELLDNEGFSVDMAASGAEALDCLSKAPYHLMLTDIKMPEMDGVELLQKVRDVFPDTTVIMMTAYATVETAVEAMKIGAVDYLIKPFEPDTLIPMILKKYEEFETAGASRIEVGAIILSGGTATFDPRNGKNTLGYGVYPNVMTNIEFERILSGCGPAQGRLIRFDGKPIKKAAWLQCIGSRDIQIDSDFCSNICCMFAIKEALVAQRRTDGDLEASILYMDMRTFGKSFQRYRDAAEQEFGVRFIRGRVHSVTQDRGTGDLLIRYADPGGRMFEVAQDAVILSVGQRPAIGSQILAERLGIQLNPWGFYENPPFSSSRTSREGIFVGGSFSGLKDISDSVIHASAAALSASRVLHASGGSLTPQPSPGTEIRNVARESLSLQMILCTCNGAVLDEEVTGVIKTHFLSDPNVIRVDCVEQACTAEGWTVLKKLVRENRPNRVLIGACMPHGYAGKLKELSLETGLSSALMEVVDIGSPVFCAKKIPKDQREPVFKRILKTGIARLRNINPILLAPTCIQQSALIVGGGIAGMSAALAIADHGYPVNLVEKEARLGGNLSWIQKTLEGHDVQSLLEDTLSRVEKHPNICVHTKSRVLESIGQAGHFMTNIENGAKEIQTITHGVVILATGGTEAPTQSYGYGTSEAIMTQKELELQLQDKRIDAAKLKSVVMIQCVDSREEPRNYCSRVCCISALKNALLLKEKNPACKIAILYRDMMSSGFSETYYTRARRADILFIQYDLKNKPAVVALDDSIRVHVHEPIIDRQIQIETDLIVLATGIIPSLPASLAQAFGASVDPDGFFQEAESKWRPVDSLKEGVFACGIAHSPRSITESIATAEAAAQRSLRVLNQKSIATSRVTAVVRHSLCSLCERCIEACPYGARILDSDQNQVLVNSLMCQGCGMCVSTCPNGAAVLEGFRKQQMFDVIDSALI